MKTKLQILIFFILLSSLIVVPTVHVNATDETDIPVLSSEVELPSASYYKREKRSIVSTSTSSSLINPVVGLLSAGEVLWDDPFMPGDESSFPGNVGDKGPIGDVSLPIIISILFVYLIYRGVSTSRRKTNL